jgi:hypothetical protein
MHSLVPLSKPGYIKAFKSLILSFSLEIWRVRSAIDLEREDAILLFVNIPLAVKRLDIGQRNELS